MKPSDRILIHTGEYEIDNRDSNTTELRLVQVVVRVDPVELFVNMLENLPPKGIGGATPNEFIEIVKDWCDRLGIGIIT